MVSIMKYPLRWTSAFFVLLVCCLLTTGVGCDSTTANKSKTQAESAEAEKEHDFRYHRPEDLNAAVVRIRELHDAFMADGPLPEPKSFRVVELIHGTGAAAHSHFHLAGDEEADHHEEGEQEKIHDYKVQPLQEFRDIVVWLPRIAGKSDLDEDQWNQVRNMSKDFGPKLDKAFEGVSDEQEKRAAYTKALGEQGAGFVETLEKLTGVKPNNG